MKHLNFCFYLVLVFFLSIFFSSCTSSRKSTGRATDKEISKSSGKGSKIKSKEKKRKAEEYASRLGISPSQDLIFELLEISSKWLGTPYKYGGSDEKGMDCSGFVNMVYKEVYKKSIPRTCQEIYAGSSPVQKKKLRQGDLLFFKIDGDKISHIGIYLNDNKFIHATTKKGVMVDDMDNPYYKKSFINAGRP